MLSCGYVPERLSEDDVPKIISEVATSRMMFFESKESHSKPKPSRPGWRNR